VRRLPEGTGSRWLTQEVKPGDVLWLSDAQGDFSCAPTLLAMATKAKV